MKKINNQRQLLHKLTTLLLVFIMTAGSISSIAFAGNDANLDDLSDIPYDTNFDMDFFDEFLNFDEDFEILNESLMPVTDDHIPLDLQHLDSNMPQSERRLMYQQLLEGNYFAIELIARFEEMFGIHSATYIRENFTTLFDISEYEIDEGLLNIIAPERIWRAEQLERSFQDDLMDTNAFQFDSQFLEPILNKLAPSPQIC